MTEAELEERLSHPTSADVDAMRTLEGDLLIVGVGGKMGPTLAALARKASDEAGVKRRILGAARFSDPAAREALEAAGVETLRCDLLDRAAVAELPDCPNVLFMAGQKFGTSSGAANLTWAINSYAPALVCERFSEARIVAFSTGNVYPLTPVDSGGPTEADPLGPVGEYAQSALARERIFGYFSDRNSTPIAILRLNYAIDLRYGVLHDIADKVHHGAPVDLTMGYANVIWQRDASSVALRAFAHCAAPPFVLNLTGSATLSVRDIAERFGRRFGVEPVFAGKEAETALLSNAARCRELFEAETVTLDQMIEWTADWVRAGGRNLGKPTHFQEREGKF